MELPLADLFSVVKIGFDNFVLFPATSSKRRHQGTSMLSLTGVTLITVKNGDAFERLGIMTLLADRKNTVKGSDNFSLGDDRDMTLIAWPFF